MRKKMEKLVEKLQTMYFTENPVNLNDVDYGYKYFICFDNTHTVAVKTKTIAEMIEELENIIENGLRSGNGIFY